MRLNAYQMHRNADDHLGAQMHSKNYRLPLVLVVDSVVVIYSRGLLLSAHGVSAQRKPKVPKVPSSTSRRTSSSSSKY